MKKLLCALLALALAAGLFACQDKLVSSPYGQEDFSDGSRIALTVEYDQYDKSVESFVYYVTNHTEETISFSADYMIEVREDGVWYTLPRSSDYQAEEAASRMTEVAPGQSSSGKFSFWSYDYEVTDGTYRLIKEIAGELCAAEFTIGAKDTSVDNPYGYQPLEALPHELGADELDCDLVLDASGALAGGSEERVGSFLKKVSEGTASMMRMVTYTIEGDPVVQDIIFENGSFLLRRDTSRDRYGEGAVAEERYAYLVTDGDTIFLSNYASPDYAGGERGLEAEQAALLEGSVFSQWETMTALVSEMTESRVAGDATMARYYSQDGTYWVNLTQAPLDYTVTSKTYGMSRTLTELSQAGEGLRIVSAQWLSETQVQFTCRLQGDSEQVWYAVFDVEEQTIVSTGR